MKRRRRLLGTRAFTVSQGDAVAIAKTTPREAVMLAPDPAYEAWVAAEPADETSPEWDAWMSKWPG